MMTEYDKDDLRIIGICLAFAFFMGLTAGDGSFTFTMFVALGAYFLTVLIRYKKGYYHVRHKKNTVVERETQGFAPKD